MYELESILPRHLTDQWGRLELQLWIPPKGYLPSEWTEKYRILGPGAQEPGPFRFIRVPYLKPIIDCLIDPLIETVVFCKAAQIGGTEFVINAMGYFADQDPCPMMFVLADEATAKYMSRERIQRMFRDSPRLKRLILEDRFNVDEILLANNAYLTMAWASSVPRLASRPVRVVGLDEIDKPGYYIATKEGNPINLAMQRTETFFNRKIILLSTPTLEEGHIWQELNSCDAVFDWHVPCPYCGQFQPLRFGKEYSSAFPDGVYLDKDGETKPLGQVVWEGGSKASDEQIEKAGYQCGSCEAVWTTIEKNKAVEKGQIVPRKPIKKQLRKVGFHVNRLYSLLGRSGDIPKLVREYLANKDDPTKLQAFINSALAEPWVQKIITTTEAKILQAKVDLEPQTVPPDAIALTAGIDVHKFGMWYVVRAWARDFTSWLIDYGLLPSWDDVAHLLFQTLYPQEGDDKRFSIWRAAIDTGGGEGKSDMSLTEEAYWFIRNNMGRGVALFGTKGSSRPLASRIQVGKALDKTPSGKSLRGGLRIVLIDTAQMKDLLHYRLSQAIEGQSQAAYLHKGAGSDYAAQINAEQKRLTRKGVKEWVKVARDNHLLDAEVLCHACVDPEWPGGGINLLRAPARIQHDKKEEKPTTKPKQKRSWVGVTGSWLRR